MSLKVSPQSLQTWKHISVLRQFHLSLGGSRLCTHGEYVKNERCAVENLHAQLLLDVAYLFGREFVVEDNHSHGAFGIFLVLYILGYLLQFARTHISNLARSAHSLRKPLHGNCTCCVGEEFQFVEIFFGLCLVLVLSDKSNEYGGFRLNF